MSIELNVLVSFAVALVVIYLIGRAFVLPIKLVGKLLINGVIGGVMLVVINIIGGIFGISIAINPLTALIAGLLGIPGVAMLLLLQIILIT